MRIAPEMRHIDGEIKMKQLALALMAGVAAITTAQASVSVTVWGGYGNSPLSASPDQAQSPVPTQTPIASFTYNGPIDWVNNTPNNGTDPTQNLFGQFFIPGDISGFTSSVFTKTEFLDTSMSSLGNSWYSFIQVLGTTGAGTATITHDDGASVYQGLTTLYTWPTQTSAVTQSFPIGTGSFTIDYIEANGSPSDLVFAVVPEPSTWALLLLGFAGLGFAGYRKSKSGPVASFT